jgi:hypothetical protein
MDATLTPAPERLAGQCEVQHFSGMEDMAGRPCRASATHLVSSGCEHEHIKIDSPRCEYHAMSDKVICRTCRQLPELGHQCKMVTITRKPYAPSVV